MKYRVMYDPDCWQPISPGGGTRQVVTRYLGPGRRLLVELERTIGGAVGVGDARIEEVSTNTVGQECHRTLERLQPDKLELVEGGSVP